MSLDQVRSYFGFTQVPFGKAVPPSALYKTAGHQEAVARFLVSEQAIGVLTGEVGSGKTVATRAAVAELEPSRKRRVPAQPGRRRPPAPTPKWSPAWVGNPGSTRLS